MSPGWERDGSGMGAGCSERIRGPHRSGPSSIPRGTASPTRDGGRLTARVGLRDTVGVLGDRSRCKKPRGHRSSGGTRLGKGAPAAARALGAAHPAHPVHPIHPVHPVHPTHTEHPEQPAYPVHPAQLGLLNPSTFPCFSITPLPGTVQNPPAPNIAPPKLLFPGTKCVRSPGPGATSARRTTRSDSRMGPSSCVPSRH